MEWKCQKESPLKVCIDFAIGYEDTMIDNKDIPSYPSSEADSIAYPASPLRNPLLLPLNLNVTRHRVQRRFNSALRL